MGIGKSGVVTVPKYRVALALAAAGGEWERGRVWPCHRLQRRFHLKLGVRRYPVCSRLVAAVARDGRPQMAASEQLPCLTERSFDSRVQLLCQLVMYWHVC